MVANDEHFSERLQVRKDLEGVVPIGERVDDRNTFEFVLPSASQHGVKNKLGNKQRTTVTNNGAARVTSLRTRVLSKIDARLVGENTRRNNVVESAHHLWKTGPNNSRYGEHLCKHGWLR